MLDQNTRTYSSDTHMTTEFQINVLSVFGRLCHQKLAGKVRSLYVYHIRRWLQKTVITVANWLESPSHCRSRSLHSKTQEVQKSAVNGLCRSVNGAKMRRQEGKKHGSF